MVGQDGLWADTDVWLHLCCSSTVEGPIDDNRTSVFQQSWCRGCGERVVGVATEGLSEVWACSGRGAAICVLGFSSVSHL
jgi:hypothetical protein